MTTVFRFKLGVLLIFLITSCSIQSETTMRLEPIGEVVIPYNYSFKDTPIGGLSGLTYESVSNTFYVISDDRSELAGARFYSFRVQLNEQGKLNKNSIQWKGMTFLKTPSGENYDLNTIDPEGIAIAPDSLVYITSEGGRSNGKPPFVNAYKKDGTFVRSLPIPEAYWAAKKEKRAMHGIRTNLAFESLTLTPDGETLYAATENALIQDGPAADTVSSSPSRIIVYSLSTGNILHEYRYDVNKVFVTGEERGPFAVNGLSDLQAINNEGHLLALDRNYVQEQGNRIGLYEVRTEGATDIKQVDNMQQYDDSIQPVKKRLVADLSKFGITIDNFEGLTFGPKLPDGSQLLLIVSDNNFSNAQQTLFTAFKLYQE